MTPYDASFQGVHILFPKENVMIEWTLLLNDGLKLRFDGFVSVRAGSLFVGIGFYDRAIATTFIAIYGHQTGFGTRLLTR